MERRDPCPTSVGSGPGVCVCVSIKHWKIIVFKGAEDILGCLTSAVVSVT